MFEHFMEEHVATMTNTVGEESRKETLSLKAAKKHLESVDGGEILVQRGQNSNFRRMKTSKLALELTLGGQLDECLASLCPDNVVSL
ncbi:hypothetical protein PIB30_049877 [Stylosanthes scabra]|uniref:Uncharacterized protein n=1 Tax=Stylosanthes scabra TaxID=79078 RepID=A0ABU6VHL1_9FABA|nr:hypothetical protein [Stylosanthes scabra]